MGHGPPYKSPRHPGSAGCVRCRTPSWPPRGGAEPPGAPASRRSREHAGDGSREEFVGRTLGRDSSPARSLGLFCTEWHWVVLLIGGVRSVSLGGPGALTRGEDGLMGKSPSFLLGLRVLAARWTEEGHVLPPRPFWAAPAAS